MINIPLHNYIDENDKIKKIAGFLEEIPLFLKGLGFLKFIQL
jgi:hypothetical protein